MLQWQARSAKVQRFRSFVNRSNIVTEGGGPAHGRGAHKMHPELAKWSPSKRRARIVGVPTPVGKYLDQAMEEQQTIGWKYAFAGFSANRGPRLTKQKECIGDEGQVPMEEPGN